MKEHLALNPQIYDLYKGFKGNRGIVSDHYDEKSKQLYWMSSSPTPKPLSNSEERVFRFLKRAKLGF